MQNMINKQHIAKRKRDKWLNFAKVELEFVISFPIHSCVYYDCWVKNIITWEFWGDFSYFRIGITKIISPKTLSL